MAKTRLNISIDQDLVDFIKIFAMENRTSVADIFTQYLLSIKRKAEGQTSEKIFSNPSFYEAMAEAQEKLRSGKSVWHTYKEVFE
ncbi:MAG: hypothetical protein HQK78_07415 [Desulfobacterales bacterium]|nr:hypothetical protein [Desulfobacterales bacterium]